MLRTAQSLPQPGPSTLGSDPARSQTKPPVCYRASRQLPGPDSHRQTTTSLRPKINYMLTSSLLVTRKIRSSQPGWKGLNEVIVIGAAASFAHARSCRLPGLR
jgi:hypothetical protein